MHVGETMCVCCWSGMKNFLNANISFGRMLTRDRRVVRFSKPLSTLESARLFSSLRSNSLNFMFTTREYHSSSLLMKDKPKNRPNSISNDDTLSRRKKHHNEEDDEQISSTRKAKNETMDVDKLKQERKERQELKKKNRLEQIEKRAKLKNQKEKKSQKGPRATGGQARGESDDESDFE
jgi:hypothetical protein